MSRYINFPCLNEFKMPRTLLLYIKFEESDELHYGIRAWLHFVCKIRGKVIAIDINDLWLINNETNKMLIKLKEMKMNANANTMKWQYLNINVVKMKCYTIKLHSDSLILTWNISAFTFSNSPLIGIFFALFHKLVEQCFLHAWQFAFSKSLSLRFYFQHFRDYVTFLFKNFKLASFFNLFNNSDFSFNERNFREDLIPIRLIAK